jgi:hypothetical protein
LSFRASYLPSSVVGLLFQGDQTANGGAGVVLGDGVRCAGGSLVRLGLHSALGGVTLYGFAVGDPRISSAGGVTAGGTYEYQVWYRDPTPYCTNATSNLTNAVEIVWQP